eukprot:349635-Chlamydomonas_euryale.AAC.3
MVFHDDPPQTQMTRRYGALLGQVSSLLKRKVLKAINRALVRGLGKRGLVCGLGLGVLGACGLGVLAGYVFGVWCLGVWGRGLLGAWYLWAWCLRVWGLGIFGLGVLAADCLERNNFRRSSAAKYQSLQKGTITQI